MPQPIRLRSALIVCLLLAHILLGPFQSILAASTFSFTSGGRGASADFTRSGSNLIVTLTNTGTADATVPTDILTAVFFDVAGAPALTRLSAIVPSPNEVYDLGFGNIVTPADRVVGGEWAYLSSPGISSSGLGAFGPGDLFPGGNLQGPASPDGIQFGIAPAGDNVLTGSGGLFGQFMIKNSVVFTLGGYTGNPSTDISHVAFQYGTSLTEPQFGGNIPEPSTIVLALCAAALMGVHAARSRRLERF